ncbi:LysR family transcriptional regulator [Paraferrimonas sedimenticola]|uniref:LysR family transcriptional regulator n=1 Tax=Paraferrimonas sedimenticola TaxID=375674 RepID=A0AA37RWG9_9GAMM|nr:LysR family transcriptional regulator [Paraferrimonas sedimenticola]GLP96363.1 LysR family transcriptional regulator [Paraferrimonas sedimenticola]
MINLEYLNVFVACVEHGSFSGAAKALNRVPSGVSMCIAKLERDMGCDLFNRDTKKATLTPAGERLFDHGKTLLRQAKRVNAIVQDEMNDGETRFVLGIGELVPISVFEEALARTMRQFPHTEFELMRGPRKTLETAFDKKDINVLIRIQASAVDTHLDYIQFAQAEVVAICSKDSELADLEEVRVEDLIEKPQIVLRSMLDNPLLQLEGMISNRKIVASSTQDLLSLVENDVGWAITAVADAQPRIEHGSLVGFMPFESYDVRGLPVDVLFPPQNQNASVLNYFIERLTTAQNNVDGTNGD